MWGPFCSEGAEHHRLSLSRWTWHGQCNQEHVLLHGIRLTQVRLNAPAWELIRKFEIPCGLEEALRSVPDPVRAASAECIEQARRAGLLVGDPQEDEDVLQQARQEYLLRAPSIVTLYVLATYRCNMRCRYCFIRGNLVASPHSLETDMTPETAAKAVEVFTRNCQNLRDDKRVIIYGGEPLLNFPAVRTAVEALRRNEALGRFQKTRVFITVLTNGLGLGDATLEFFAAHEVSAGISLDGPAEVNDAMRVDAVGGGSHARITHAIERCRAHGVKWAISCTVAAHNVKVLPACARHFVEDLGARHIGYNLISPLERGDPPGDVPVEEAVASMLATEAYLLRHGVAEARYARRRMHLRRRICRAYDCTGCGAQIIVTPDAMMGPCHAYSASRKFCVPLDESVDVHELPQWQEWARRSPFNMPECYEHCRLIGLCGGGCPYAADVRGGSIWRRDERCCREVALAAEEAIRETPCCV